MLFKLFSIRSFCDHVGRIESCDTARLVIKDLMEQMTVLNQPIKTVDYVQNLCLIGYQDGQQYDAQECLIQILRKS